MRKTLLLVMSMLLLYGQMQAQTRTVSGKVTEENGNPIPGATVQVRGSSLGTTTNPDGSFSFSVPTGTTTLIISFVGFNSLTITIPESGIVTASLSKSNVELEGIVVTGYSNQKKSEYAGAATKVDKGRINFVPNASIDQILQGRAPGLLVTAGSGQPGAAARVQIRGASSITGGNQPLFVVDGVPVENSVFQSLNPNDFESVDVLRDAVSTSLYGNRGAAGVIVITTKKGKAGKAQLSYSGQYGITQPAREKFEMMNSAELLKFQEILGSIVPNNLPGWVYSPLNPGYDTLTDAEKAIPDNLRSINTNWKDVFMRQGKFQSHDLSLSGGSANTKFYISGGYYNEEGISIRSDLKRYTLRANIEHKADKLTFSLSSGVGYTQRNFIESEGGIFLANPFAAAYLGLPYQRVYTEDGKIDVGPGKTGANAYDRYFSTSNGNNQTKATISANVNYAITDNIYIGGFAGLDYRQTVNEASVFPNTYASNNDDFPTGPEFPNDPTSVGGGNYRTGYNNAFEYIVRAFAGYKRSFDQKHDINVQLISEYTRDHARALNYTGYGINPKLLGTPAGITPGDVDNKLIAGVGGSKTGRTLYAAMLTGTYSYLGKYNVSLSLRRDASSQLPENNRWQNFYAVGVNWNVLKEEFTSNWTTVSDLRLRVSYGTSANADGFPIGNFGYLSTYGSGVYAGNPTIVPTQPGNPNLNWEKVANLNIGIDYGFFNNRITGTLDVYNKLMTDAIVTQKLPFESGFASQNINAAKVRNRGIELQLSVDVVRTRDFVWSVGGNISYNDNEVTDLGQVNEFEQGTEIVRVGLPLGSHYIVKWGGVDAATGKPLYYTKDGQLTDVYSDDDRVADFGTFNAPWIGGFNTGIRYKDFTIDAFFSFQKGFSRFNNQDFFQLNHAFATQGFNLYREMLTMWQKPGDVTNIQSPLTQRQFVSKDIQDASYVRFRNLRVAYNFNPRLLGSLKVLSAAQFFVQAQNLYTWTNWTGFDPEDDNNIASYEYPSPRTFTLGLNVTFK